MPLSKIQIIKKLYLAGIFTLDDIILKHKKIDGKSIGLSQEFKSKLEAWNYLVQFEEGNIL